MPKLINNWEELFKCVSKDYKYRIKPDNKLKSCRWIEPIFETEETNSNYFKHHCYLSTHTFYGEHYLNSTYLLQSYGFDVVIDNWDKENNYGRFNTK